MLKRKNAIGYLFCAPQFLLIVLFMAYPIINGIFLGFHEWDGLGAKEFIAFENYKDMLHDRTFWIALKNTFVYALISMAGNVALGLLLALSVSRRKGVNFYRVVFYLPVLLSGTAVALMWSRIYEPTAGLLNSLMSLVGLESLTTAWLGNPDTAMGATLVVAIWKHCGFPMILFITAILSIPKEVYEASELDGASRLQENFYITLPMIRNVFLTVLTLQLINSMKAFDTIWVMTAGGPGTTTTVLTLEIYLEAFRHSNYGYASALSTVLIAIIVFIKFGLNKITAKYED